jgi:hypothetical protein
MADKLETLVCDLGNILVPKDVPSDYLYWIDGVPVNEELFNFCAELRKKFPQVKYHANDERNKIMRRGMLPPVYSDVTVYVDNCEVVLGYIAYGITYGVELRSDDTYVVMSRHIQNNKYGEHREQHNRSYTTDLTKAVKTARSALLPYSAKELVNLSISTYSYKLNEENQKYYTAYRSVLHPLAYQDVIGEEMYHLIQQGVTFTTPKFVAAAAAFMEKRDEYKRIDSKKGNAYFVSLRTVGDNVYADIAEVNDLKNTSGYRSAAPAIIKSVLVNDLPEDIQGKIAVLSILNNNQHVEGVGFKVSPKMFWLEREDA